MLRCRAAVLFLENLCRGEGHTLLLHRDTEDKYLSPQYTSLVGTILLGQDYRDNHKDQLVRQPGFFDRMKESTLDMFIDQN